MGAPLRRFTLSPKLAPVLALVAFGIGWGFLLVFRLDLSQCVHVILLTLLCPPIFYDVGAALLDSTWTWVRKKPLDNLALSIVAGLLSAVPMAGTSKYYHVGAYALRGIGFALPLDVPPNGRAPLSRPLAVSAVCSLAAGMVVT